MSWRQCICSTLSPWIGWRNRHDLNWAPNKQANSETLTWGLLKLCFPVFVWGNSFLRFWLFCLFFLKYVELSHRWKLTRNPKTDGKDVCPFPPGGHFQVPCQFYFRESWIEDARILDPGQKLFCFSKSASGSRHKSMTLPKIHTDPQR